MAALRTHYVEISQHTDNADGSLSVTAIARRSGIMRYRSDSGDRLEFVPPELIDARDEQGRPVMGMLAGAPNTNEHPAQIIRYSTDSRKAVQVGKVNEEIHIFNDADGERSVKVRFDVSDPETIEDIRSGRKKGVSLGYLCNVVREDGEYRGQKYTHKQAMPFSIDHLAIVANPRNPGALITRFDSDDIAVISMDTARSPLEVIRVDGCCAACSTKSDDDEKEEEKPKKEEPKTDAIEVPMIPIVFAEAIHSVTVEQAQGLWMDGTIDRVRFDGVDYFMAADVALSLSTQGLIHEDAFIARAGIKKGGGVCGRGWVGVKGSCKQVKKGMGDRDTQHKAALKEFSQGQRFKGSSKGTKSLMGIGMGKHQEAARDKQSAELGKLIKEKTGRINGSIHVSDRGQLLSQVIKEKSSKSGKGGKAPTAPPQKAARSKKKPLVKSPLAGVLG